MTVKDNRQKETMIRKEIPAYTKKRDALASSLQATSCEEGRKIALQKSTSNLFRPKTSGEKDKKIDVRSFNCVLDVDRENLIAQVEGMTTFETLVNETLKYGCLPAVVPELKTITIGGAIAGCGIESSSFKYGLVHETVLEMEILLGNGSIVRCNRDNEHKDLFYAFPNTFGTLGYALKVDIKLIPVKPFVKLTHHRFDNPDTYFEAMGLVCRRNRESGDAAYIDGVIFGRNEMYIITAQFVDEAPFTSDYTFMKMYYKSIQERKVDYLTIKDYIWRWDPDWFWCSKVFGMQNRLARFLLGKWMLGSEVYGKIMHFFNRHPLIWRTLSFFRSKKESVIQDIAIPLENALAFFDFFREIIGITPIWICPTQAYSKSEHFDFCPMETTKLYLDFGFWDSVNTDREEGYYNRQIEKMTASLNGFKSLYSTSYYSEDEFWSIYNKAKYDEIKNRYDPEKSLRNLFTKCTTHSS